MVQGLLSTGFLLNEAKKPSRLPFYMSTVGKTTAKLAIIDLEQESANFYKGLVSKYLHSYGPNGLCCNDLA
ncbi:hypothetical protein Celaphus_00008493 [Cervus elaphus hippelaphus]|uniref:Uncharacterized protein n=1 Tax=Cervus elaphus hippelaphus TaxID=46360 RepID=A0A212CQ54_CEREH|nr:hypothetical protein Celaphus_00008493 [Cervus elaphus hippelaphus]